MKTLAEKIAVMQAAERGEKIEWRPVGKAVWSPIIHPTWHWGEYDYRVVPRELKIMEEKPKCNDWHLIGENTAGPIYLCSKCGALKDCNGVITDGPVSAVDRETLYCPDQKYIP